ncbi:MULTISPECIES: hypothetical protein [Achromobacter]|uniref:Uncharacterized protein n=1 Tax=Achromobacter spanius TaxID=217203 RepID=A0AA42S7C3_9BURK|nr:MULTISPECIES: hypothetical protein [Achromobacter]MCD0501106.1 hypothetical protein [Achromobacter sp. MY14]MCS3505569.1 hypothetical protein [Achromobacter sp. JUb104]MDH0739421.1 hypothetical protein [Achromobacter spanius]
MLESALALAARHARLACFIREANMEFNIKDGVKAHTKRAQARTAMAEGGK